MWFIIMPPPGEMCAKCGSTVAKGTMGNHVCDPDQKKQFMTALRERALDAEMERLSKPFADELDAYMGTNEAAFFSYLGKRPAAV